MINSYILEYIKRLGDGKLKEKLDQLKEKLEQLKEKVKEIFKSSKTRSYILVGVAAICLVLMAVGAFQMIRIQVQYRQSAALYEELTQFLSFEPIEVGGSGAENGNDELEEDGEVEEFFQLPAGVQIPQVDFDGLREINPNIVGWIILEGTQINYPVVQGEDNIYFLNRLYDGRWNPSGTIFMDYLNDPNMRDFHTILYGHHMQDGSMFAAIEFYVTQPDFIDRHPYIFFITPEREYVIKPFTGYKEFAYGDHITWQLDFEDEAQKQEWLNNRRNRSDFPSNIEVLPSHRFVTLSTCSMVIIDHRTVVTGRIMPIAR